MKKRQAIQELTTALYHTQAYVGDDLLPRLPGWSWFDALTKYAPALLETPVAAAVEEAGVLEEET